MSGKTLGRIGYEALQAARWPDDPTAWTHPGVAVARPAWETAMQAVAAHLGALECTPLAATAEDDSAAEITRLRAALEDIARAAQGSIDAGLPTDYDWFVSRAMEGLGWLPEGWPKAPQPAPELAAELDQLRERVARVAAALDADALATAPSKKSQIQEDAARRIREAIG